jgi:hypothetical protein
VERGDLTPAYTPKMSNGRSNDDGVQYVRTDRGLVEVDPTGCPNGHELKGNMSRGWVPCACSAEITGHRTWTCETCQQTVYAPPCLDESKSAGHWKR